MVPFLGKKLLFVVAHPDDESFIAAGAIYENQKRGGKNYIICATYGEQGKAHLKTPVSLNQLKHIRKKEIQQVAKFLKTDGLYFLNFPDTKLINHQAQLTAKVEKLAKKIKPDYILSFGQDGISGHLDHITIGQVAKKIAKKFKTPFVAFAASPAIRNNFENITARRKHGKYKKSIRHALPNLKLKVNYKVKQKTLSFHKSQAGPSTLSAGFRHSIRKSFLTYEYFRI